VEGHHADLERHAGHDEHQPEHQEVVIARRERADARRHLRDGQRAGRAVDHRHAVEEQPRGQRAKHEILHRRLGGQRRVPVQRDERVQAQRHQLEPQKHGEEAVGAREQHHAEQREQQQAEEFAAQQPAIKQPLARVDQRRRHRGVEHEVHYVREEVGDEQAIEEVVLGEVDPLGVLLRLGEGDHEKGGRQAQRQRALGGPVGKRAPLVLREGIGDHHYAGTHQQHRLGQRGKVVEERDQVHSLEAAMWRRSSFTEACITSVKGSG